VLLSVFEWCENSVVGTTIRSSVWLFPAIESVHLIALSVLGGAVLITNLRLMGLGLREAPMAVVSLNARPWLLRSLVIMFITGGLLFASEAIKCYYNGAFWLKMLFFSLSVIFTFAVVEPVTLRAQTDVSPGWRRTIAVVALALWTGVGIMGRGIGFY
jgi:uncharacterized protein DUF6644